jgi:hypothetical protein
MVALISHKIPLQDNSKAQPYTAEDVAAYSASMLVHLHKMAQATNLPMLAYLLDMARLEAEAAFD